MPIFVDKFKIPQNVSLSRYLDRSKQLMTEYKNNMFQTTVFKNLLTDRFDYQGTKPNTILVQDKVTEEPVELDVVFEHIEISPYVARENWKLYNKKGKLVGSKYYGIQKRLGDSTYMRTGSMSSYSKNLRGIGTRLDQFHVERALQLGINEIPRTAQPRATYFHAMMGFTPVQGHLIPIENNNLAEAMEKAFYYLDKIDFEPIIIEKEGAYYIDCNATLANANLNKCKDFCADNKKEKIEKKLKGQPTTLMLTGEELQKWKEAIKGHTILDKLNFDFPFFR